MLTPIYKLTIVILLTALACCACSPAKPKADSSKPTIPQIPEISDVGLRRQLYTLHAMATEYAKLASSASTLDEKTTQRLQLLKKGIEDIAEKCRADIGAAGQHEDEVREFLRQCISATSQS